MAGVQEARQSGSSGLTSQIHLKPLALEARAWDPAWGGTDVLWEETRGRSQFCPGGQGQPKSMGALLSSHQDLRVVGR